MPMLRIKLEKARAGVGVAAILRQQPVAGVRDSCKDPEEAPQWPLIHSKALPATLRGLRESASVDSAYLLTHRELQTLSRLAEGHTVILLSSFILLFSALRNSLLGAVCVSHDI